MSKGNKKPEEKKSSVTDVPLKYSGEVYVVPTKKASKPAPDKKIHQRRELPLVPEAPDDETEESSE